MQSQVLREQALAVWVRYLRGHAALTRELNAQLVGRHGLTVNDYEVLLLLSNADERRMRRVDLADEVLLTPSGITRLLDGLERRGYVARASCPADRRVIYAVITDEGFEALRASSAEHLAGVEAQFASHYDEDELRTLAELLGRLANDDDDGSCSPPDA